jgi:hypothetical protein
MSYLIVWMEINSINPFHDYSKILVELGTLNASLAEEALVFVRIVIDEYQ